jgi:hypothetical protein
MACKSLRQDEQARFDPMITGFNPTDMYAADHVRRVLHTFPGVFSGIGKAAVVASGCGVGLACTENVETPAADLCFVQVCGLKGSESY